MHYSVNRQLLKDTAKELESWAAIPCDTCCPEHGACMMKEAEHCHLADRTSTGRTDT